MPSIFEGSCGQDKKNKYWWSLLKMMEMEISVGAREKNIIELSQCDFLEKRREALLNLRTWFANASYGLV